MRGATDLSSRIWPLLSDKRLLAAAFSIAIGIAHPFCTELSKTAELQVCSAGACEMTSKRAMPFHVITLTLTSQTLAVAVAALKVTLCRGSMQAGARELLDPRAFGSVLFIGILYGAGDLLQTIACNVSSAPVVLIVGQSKLFLTAVLSKLCLAACPALNHHKWLRLLTISLAAVAAVDTTQSMAEDFSDSALGALLALFKAVLSSAGAIVSESVYKKGAADFWVVSFHVQSAMLLTSLVLLCLDMTGEELPFSFGELFFKGPYAPCPCMPTPGESTCVCSSRSGWDMWTWLAVLAIVLNGYATGFFLKNLSAVCKAVCNLASSGLGCLACWLCHLSSCSLTQALVSCIVLLQSFDYALEKAEECRNPRKEHDNQEWASQYQSEVRWPKQEARYLLDAPKLTKPSDCRPQ